MKIETIRQVGIENGLKDTALWVFVEFFNRRFPDELDSILSYVTQWAERFKTGEPENYMDSESQLLYSEVLEESVLR